jgi:hypothetical protein
MQITTCTRQILERSSLGPSVAVISMHDFGTPPPRVRTTCLEQLVLCVNDTVSPLTSGVMPNKEIAKAILDFAQKHQKDATVFVAQCEAGVGRSVAVAAALTKIWGGDPTPLLRRGTHNRLLYRLILEAAGEPPLPIQPLASIVVRIKYPVDRLQAFLLSMQRQRYTAWECVLITDGPRPDVREFLATAKPPNCRFIETPEVKGCWGYHYKQQGIDACQGEFIGLQNDDNWLCPGFLEQLVWALSDGAELALCDMVHSHLGWQHYQTSPRPGECDLGSWLARTELVRKVAWPGTNFDSDGVFVQRMAEMAKRVVNVRRPLYVHN